MRNVRLVEPAHNVRSRLPMTSSFKVSDHNLENHLILFAGRKGDFMKMKEKIN